MPAVEKPASSWLGRELLCLGALLFVHAAWSVYENVAVRKSLGLESATVPIDMTIEAIVALLLVAGGLMLGSAPLREITWASEYRSRTIADVDARSSFATLNHRGPAIFGAA